MANTRRLLETVMSDAIILVYKQIKLCSKSVSASAISFNKDQGKLPFEALSTVYQNQLI